MRWEVALLRAKQDGRHERIGELEVHKRQRTATSSTLFAAFIACCGTLMAVVGS